MSWTPTLSAEIIALASPDFYTEGPAADAEGNIYVTTITGGSIIKISAGGVVSEWARGGFPNGQIILKNGDHLVCDCRNASIMRFDKQGALKGELLKGSCGGVSITTPNDLARDSRGNLYFTDSVRHTGKLCRLSPGGKEKILAQDLDYPNGVAVSSDERYLYVAESYRNRILKVDLNKDDGDNISVLADLPANASGKETDNLPDGLTIGFDGSLWVAHYGMQAVHQYSVSGELLKSVDTGIPLTSNLVFMDENTLVVTGGFGEPGPGKVVKLIL